MRRGSAQVDSPPTRPATRRCVPTRGLTSAVEGANGAGRPLAQRLLEAGEQVVDVPARLAARIRLFECRDHAGSGSPG